MTNKTKVLNVGDKIETNSFGDLIILEKIDWSKVKVKFIQTGYITFATAQSIQKGNVKDKLLPIIFGVGFIGDGEFMSYSKTGGTESSYITWANMIKRCYSKEQQIKQPSYVGCTVCDEWHNYQNFARWFSENKKPNTVLDKDIILDGNKVYSPEFCSFVSPSKNIEKAHAKRYKFISPQGELNEIYNLRDFCKKRGLNQSSMCQVNKGRFSQHKGWRASQ